MNIHITQWTSQQQFIDDEQHDEHTMQNKLQNKMQSNEHKTKYLSNL
jgi:hypothetical protein